MKTIIVLKESEATRNRICDTLISTLIDIPELITKNNELKICTNMIFEGIELFQPFNAFLRMLRSQGIVCIMIDLDN